MEIIRDLLIFVPVMFALCIVLIVVISKMPDDNPPKRMLTALSYRLGATLAAGTVAIPVEPIPGLDVLYDIAVPIALIWYWFTFFRDTLRSRAEELQLREHRQTKQGSAQTVDSPTSDGTEPRLRRLLRISFKRMRRSILATREAHWSAFVVSLSGSTLPLSVPPAEMSVSASPFRSIWRAGSWMKSCSTVRCAEDGLV